ncbi:hypothetical protein Leucomu_13435 [Leucobacter muris]|uniref:Uncharacterized protein n=1 Tax=Leucobacter muris TaxID=1935379 RepID=A0ABX5QIJ4_9MICO|nr:hypothetical protein [Leucobacter muris]QAB18778.1 hypothetical protein Leucomu_13435 [Leucobacter muris]
MSARDGAMVCDRCFGRLRSRIELIPDLVAMLRSLADPRKAAVYDRPMVSGAAPEGIPAPVPADIIDAQVDLLHTISAGQLRPGAESDEAYDHALRAVAPILASFDAIANDEESFLQWWSLVVPAASASHPEFWTVTRVLGKWPLEDRRRWAAQPCPQCGLKSVRISPPRHRYALTWFSCSKCEWRRSERDDDGVWASAFGLHADAPAQEGVVAPEAALHPDLDLRPAISSGAARAALVSDGREPGEVFEVFMVGAVPELGEAFARLAEQVAAVARSSYKNGGLLAAGARLVAEAIREAAEDVHAEGIGGGAER